MATQTRSPSSDLVSVGTWSGTAGQRWQLVDDYPSQDAADRLNHGTTAGHIKFGFAPFAVPVGSTGISVQLLYYDYKSGGGQAQAGGALRLGSTPTDHNAATHNPGNGIANIALRTDNFPTNPKSGAAWTVADINGSGTNFLVGFGWRATDANPVVSFTSLLLQVTYTPPPVISTKVGLGLLGCSASGIGEVEHIPPPPPPAPTNLRKV